MGDWIFENFGWVLVALGAVLIGLIYLGAEQKQKLMAQCMADGKKEYECRAMINQGDTTYIPIVIPIR